MPIHQTNYDKLLLIKEKKFTDKLSWMKHEPYTHSNGNKHT